MNAKQRRTYSGAAAAAAAAATTIWYMPMDESYFPCISSSIYLFSFVCCMAFRLLVRSLARDTHTYIVWRTLCRYTSSTPILSSCIQFNLQSHVYAIEYQMFVCFVFLFDVFVCCCCLSRYYIFFFSSLFFLFWISCFVSRVSAIVEWSKLYSNYKPRPQQLAHSNYSCAFVFVKLLFVHVFSVLSFGVRFVPKATSRTHRLFALLSLQLTTIVNSEEMNEKYEQTVSSARHELMQKPCGKIGSATMLCLATVSHHSFWIFLRALVE